MTKNQQSKFRIRGERYKSLLVEISSGRFSPPFSVSGVGESRSMEFTMSSAARATASEVLGGSSFKGLGAEEVTSTDPLVSRSTLLQVHTRVKSTRYKGKNLQ